MTNTDRNNNDIELYKFRKINKRLFESLIHSNIYFARPSHLNDPLDCRVDIRESVERAILKSHPESRPKLEKLRDENWFFKKAKKKFEDIGVCSFSREQSNSLMWSHYADEHRGVCLKYHFPESFFVYKNYGILGWDDIKYGAYPLTDWLVKNANEIDTTDGSDFLMELIQTALVVKALSWEHEEEARIVRGSDGEHAVDQRFLKQVCFGLETPESDITLVTNLLDHFGYKVTCCRIIRSTENDFSLDVVPL